MQAPENPNPEIHQPLDLAKLKAERDRVRGPDERDPIDALEVYEMVRNINDPEHPLTLEQLKVVEPGAAGRWLYFHVGFPSFCAGLIAVDDARSTCDLLFTPTIPHCSMATLIGLSLRVKLLRSLPSRFKITININPGTHASEKAVNKQLNDKERVQAALENDRLLSVVQQCLAEKK